MEILLNLRVLIRPDPEDGGFVVSCPALPGCHSQGETVEEALANIREAIDICLEVLNGYATASLRPDLPPHAPSGDDPVQDGRRPARGSRSAPKQSEARP